jgi:5-(carboxyamino)imidazole ribonucleotide synthase
LLKYSSNISTQRLFRLYGIFKNTDDLLKQFPKLFQLHDVALKKISSFIKDKFLQKEFLTEHGIPVAPYAVVESKEDVEAFAVIHSYPVVLKARRGAYDGRGNRTVTLAEDIDLAMTQLGTGLYVEAWVPFVKELAVVAARGEDGTIHPYPVVETIHVDHICDTVIAPAPVSEEVKEKAEALARQIMDIFQGAGVFGIEMFLTENGEVLINEIAPRVHNSGHLTLGGSSISQFAQHMRAVCGELLIAPVMKNSAAVMKNILGKRNAPADPRGIEEAEALGAFVEIYGKHETKEKRKMGHLTVIANTPEEAFALAVEAHTRISI